MNEDTLKSEIEDWIDWSRENLSSLDDLPLIGDSAIEPPWREDALEYLRWYERAPENNELAALCRLFEFELAGNPSDVAIRFPALDFYHEVVRIESYYVGEDPILHCSQGIHFVRQFFEQGQKYFDYIVKLLPVEALNEWRSIKWEIVNACAAQEWDLARRLYDRAYDLGLPDSIEIQLLRGQFHFLVTFHKAKLLPELLGRPILGLFFWEPDVKIQLALGVFIHLRVPDHLLDTDYSNIRGDDSMLRTIRHAVTDLENGLRNKPDSYPHRSLLAMSYFALEDYPNAAKHFELLLKHPPQKDSLRTKMRKALAECYRLAGQYDRARSVLEESLQLFPGQPGFHRQLAYLEAQHGDFKKAYQSLLAETEIDPTLGEDPDVSIALALGGVLDARDAQGLSETLAARLLERHPEISDLVDSLHKEYWSTYALLSDTARHKWLLATTEMYSLTLREPKLKQSFLVSAAENFAQAVEIELREHVFNNFRKAKLASSDQIERKTFSGDLIISKFQKICLDPDQKINLTLGQMAGIIDRPRNDKDPFVREFYRWLEGSHPRLFKEIWILKQINQIRAPAAHGGSVSAEEAMNMPGKCRRLLDALLNNPAK